MRVCVCACVCVCAKLLQSWLLGFPSGLAVKNPLAMREPQEMWVQSLGQEDPLEEDMATHSSILAWRIPWTEEPWTVHRVAESQSQLKQLSTCTFWLLLIHLNI